MHLDRMDFFRKCHVGTGIKLDAIVFFLIANLDVISLFPEMLIDLGLVGFILTKLQHLKNPCRIQITITFFRTETMGLGFVRWPVVSDIQRLWSYYWRRHFYQCWDVCFSCWSKILAGVVHQRKTTKSCWTVHWRPSFFSAVIWFKGAARQHRQHHRCAIMTSKTPLRPDDGIGGL